MREDNGRIRLATKVTTQCPQCGAQFDVTMAQLQLRKGFVRCVRCTHIFDGYARVVAAHETGADSPENTAVAQARQAPPEHSSIASPPAVIRQRHTIAFHTKTAHETNTFSISEPEHIQSKHEPVWRLEKTAFVPDDTPASEPADSPTRPQPLPDFLQNRAQRHWTVWFWGALCLAALIGLLLQAVVIYRMPLASQFPTTRPALERVCRMWGCTVPYPRNIDQIAILASALRMQPQTDPADQHLVLHLTLRNQGARAQQWPNLRLDLTDFSGAVLIRKHLAPSDYLPVGLAHQAFDAQSELALRLPLRVQTSEVKGYQITPFFP